MKGLFDENLTIEEANELIDSGADVNEIGKGITTPLHLAAWHTKNELIELLLKKKSKVNARNIYLSTPLHIAALLNNHCGIKLLLKAGADRNLKNKDGNKPIDLSMYSHNTVYFNEKCVNLLSD